jgi:hypothetical protein
MHGFPALDEIPWCCCRRQAWLELADAIRRETDRGEMR